MGSRRRSAASASRARVAAFSFTNNCSRARCHSSRETIGGWLVSDGFSEFSMGGMGCLGGLLVLLLQKFRGHKSCPSGDGGSTGSRQRDSSEAEGAHGSSCTL